MTPEESEQLARSVMRMISIFALGCVVGGYLQTPAKPITRVKAPVTCFSGPCEVGGTRTFADGEGNETLYVWTGRYWARAEDQTHE